MAARINAMFAACNDDPFQIQECVEAIASNTICLLICVYNRCFKFLFSRKLLAIIRLRKALPDGLVGENVENFEPEAILASHDICNLCNGSRQLFVKLKGKTLATRSYADAWAGTMTGEPSNVVKIESLHKIGKGVERL
jgi:hypothetical protein